MLLQKLTQKQLEKISGGFRIFETEIIDDWQLNLYYTKDQREKISEKFYPTEYRKIIGIHLTESEFNKIKNKGNYKNLFRSTEIISERGFISGIYSYTPQKLDETLTTIRVLHKAGMKCSNFNSLINLFI